MRSISQDFSADHFSAFADAIKSIARASKEAISTIPILLEKPSAVARVQGPALERTSGNLSLAACVDEIFSADSVDDVDVFVPDYRSNNFEVRS